MEDLVTTFCKYFVLLKTIIQENRNWEIMFGLSLTFDTRATVHFLSVPWAGMGM